MPSHMCVFMTHMSLDRRNKSVVVEWCGSGRGDEDDSWASTQALDSHVVIILVIDGTR